MVFGVWYWERQQDRRHEPGVPIYILFPEADREGRNISPSSCPTRVGRWGQRGEVGRDTRRWDGYGCPKRQKIEGLPDGSRGLEGVKTADDSMLVACLALMDDEYPLSSVSG